MLRWVSGCAVAVFVIAGAAAEPSIKRGDYLVNTVMTCGHCHSPFGPPAAVAGREFSGGIPFDEDAFNVTAPNITPDAETGIGRWSDADIRRLLLTGIRPDGRPVAEVMPTAFYPILTADDLNSIIAYLRSLKPVKNKVPDPVYKVAVPHRLFPGAERSLDEADLIDKTTRGRYLATIGLCLDCHTPSRDPDGADQRASLGKGGREFPGPWGVAVSKNITSDRVAGLGDWSDDEIKTAITRGKHRDGTAFKGPMAYWSYARMTDADIDAVVAFLRTLPPK